MSLRGLVVAATLLAAAALAWQKREQLQAWAGQAPTLATLVPTSSEPSAGARPGADGAKPRPGGLRKCVKGQQVAYTNVECPPGYQDQAVTAAPVNVLPATPVSKPVASSSAPSALHQALDITRDDKLRDKLMERAVEGSR